MSRKIHIDSVPVEERKQMMTDLTIKMEGSSFVYNSQPTYIYPFEVTEEDAYIPFAYAKKFSRPDLDSFTKSECKFNGKLRDYQKDAKNEAITHLNKYGSTIISCFPGWGKTSVSLYIATKIRLKTLIVIHRIVLINQWKQAIKRFCPDSKIQVLTSKSTLDKDADFYIMNPINIPKQSREFYSDMGTVIIDESHLIMSEVLSKCMHMLVPRYLLGLSATPYREDGMNILLDLYFGKKRIHRKLFREHKVYKLKTNFTPEIELAKNGRVNWGALLDSQAMDENRNELIVRLVHYFPDRIFLILCKRVEQGHYLVKRLEEEGEDVTSLIGKNQEYEQSSRILVGTIGKVGVGFDHPRLNTLLLAGDVQAYFIQILGRVMRTEDGDPMVLDIVDRNPILERHFKVRNAVYLEHGGKVCNFSSKFTDFQV